MLISRSEAECRQYIALHPHSCGETAFPHVWEGPCPRCGELRRFEFRIEGDPKEPSQLIDPGEYLAIADRAADECPPTIAGLPRDRAMYFRGRLVEAITAMEEVMRFLPHGEDIIPPSAFFSNPAAYGIRQFARPRLGNALATYREFLATYDREMANQRPLIRKKIRDLDFDAIVATIVRSTNVAKRTTGDPVVQGELSFIKTRADGVDYLRIKIANAIANTSKSPDLVQYEQPLVEAFVRVHHHPRAAESVFRSARAENGADFGPRLLEIADAHVDARFDLPAIKQALHRAILVYGDDELDDTKSPWLMYWNRAGSAADAFIFFVTLSVLGDLAIEDDEWERGITDHEREQFERTKSIKPLKLD